MRIVIFTLSPVSGWNRGNAHFLRGVASGLARRGRDLRILEPAGGWSRSRLIAEFGEEAVTEFGRANAGAAL